ncbi:hypothetical protein [Arthrobacter sp. RIT-PI-e]|uniref:hypothetical protein n=1 Tax=Arthrobacter sp. RIT-PI-e TaxID=1681197 RepID=UPI001F4040C9|nr:hypothetical protein [Arthrobacter sp. RIT-PI-e]
MEATCYGELTAGQRVTVILVEADIARRRIRFEAKPADATPAQPDDAVPGSRAG